MLRFCENCDHEQDLHIDNRHDCIVEDCVCPIFEESMNVIFSGEPYSLSQDLEQIIIYKLREVADELMAAYPNLKIMSIQIDAIT